MPGTHYCLARAPSGEWLLTAVEATKSPYCTKSRRCCADLEQQEARRGVKGQHDGDDLFEFDVQQVSAEVKTACLRLPGAILPALSSLCSFTVRTCAFAFKRGFPSRGELAWHSLRVKRSRTNPHLAFVAPTAVPIFCHAVCSTGEEQPSIVSAAATLDTC